MLIKLLTEAHKGRQNSSAKHSEAHKGQENSSAKRDKYLAPPGESQFLTEARKSREKSSVKRSEALKGRENSSTKRDKYSGQNIWCHLVNANSLQRPARAETI